MVLEFCYSDAASAAGRPLELTPQGCRRLTRFPSPLNGCCLHIPAQAVLHDRGHAARQAKLLVECPGRVWRPGPYSAPMVDKAHQYQRHLIHH